MSEVVVSVVIATYNRAGMLARAVDSVLEQDYGQFELIVSDDGSTDDTPDVLAQYGDTIRVVSGPNGGFALARHRAIAVSRGELIANHDSDDIMLAGRLAAQAEFLLQHPEVGAVSGNIQIEGGTRNYLEQQGVDFAGKPWVIHEDVFPLLLRSNIMADPATMLRKSAYDLVGGYDPSLRIAADWDLWLRMARWRALASMNAPVTRFTRHEGNISASPKRQAELLRIIDKALRGSHSWTERDRTILHYRLERALTYYVRTNLADPFEEGWRAYARYVARHLPDRSRAAVVAMTYLPRVVWGAMSTAARSARHLTSRSGSARGARQNEPA